MGSQQSVHSSDPSSGQSEIIFGGLELTYIFFIASAGQSEIMPIMPPGYDPHPGNFGGPFFHLNLGIAGPRSNPANLTFTGYTL